MPIFLAIISHLNEILIKGGQKRIKAGRISNEQVKCRQKVTSCGKMYLKEHDFLHLQGTWKFPCTFQAIYLTCKHLARISMYLLSNLPHMQTFGKVMEISMYLATKHMTRYMEMPMYLEMKRSALLMKISKLYLENETNGKVHGHFHTLPYVSL